MTKEELKNAFIHKNLGYGVMHCDEEKVKAGLETLDNLIKTAETIDSDSNTYISDFQNIDRFYGFVQNNNLSEDNLFYDLNIPSYTEGNTEHVVDKFREYTTELKDLVTNLKKDIEATVSAIKIYNNRSSYSPGELGAAAEGISLFDDYVNLSQYIKPDTGSQFSGGGYRSNVSGRVSAAKTPVNDVVKNDNGELKQTLKAITTTPNKDISENKITTSNKDTDLPNNTLKSEEPEKKKATVITKNPTIKDNLNDTKKEDQAFGDKTNNVNKGGVTSIGSSGTSHGGGGYSQDGYQNNNGYSFKNAETSTGGTATVATSIASTGKKAIENVKGIINDGDGKLASSVANIAAHEDRVTTISKIAKPGEIEETSSVNQFVPPVAAIGAAGVAGFGTKYYADNKKQNKSDSSEEEEQSQLQQQENMYKKDIVTKEAEKPSDFTKEPTEEEIKIAQHKKDYFAGDEIL